MSYLLQTLKVVLIIPIFIGIYIVINITVNHQMAESFCKNLAVGQEYGYVINRIKPPAFSKYDVSIIPTYKGAEKWSGVIQVKWREHLSRYDWFCTIVVQDEKVLTSYTSSRDNS
ncbi:MAG: hypothetical protein LBB76_11840 [Azoarcus sp.]|nr:hypothetical protein [Azoarcus sp.]